MSITLNEIIISKGRKVNYKLLVDEIIKLLEEEGSLTFGEISNKLDIKNGDRQLLLDALIKLESEGRIKRENTQIIIENGISFTSRFFL